MKSRTSMKSSASRNATKPVFEPVTITIVLETAEEVQAAYDLGNWSFQVGAKVSQLQGADNASAVKKVAQVFHGHLVALFGCIGDSPKRIA
jgi:hypothetical protein